MSPSKCNPPRSRLKPRRLARVLNWARARGRARSLLPALCLLTATGCAEHVARTDLLAQIEAGTPPPIVDVRTDAEYTTSHVADSA
jgi:hypothetical protein